MSILDELGEFFTITAAKEEPVTEVLAQEDDVRLFHFDIEPICVQSVRMGKFHTFQPKRVVQYKKAIREMAIAQCPGEPWEGLIEVLPITIAFKWPVNTPKYIKKAYEEGKVIYHDRKRDLEDNLLKGVYDALSGVVYMDDCKIVKSNGRRKIYAPHGYIEIGFRKMPGDTVVIPNKG